MKYPKFTIFLYLFIFTSYGHTQNRVPINGFSGAMEAVMQIVDKNPVIYSHLSAVHPNNIAMCAAVGIYASAQLAVNIKSYNDSEVKVQALNAGIMTKAYSRLNSTGVLPEGSLQPHISLLKQEGGAAFNKMWPLCDKINSSILPLIREDFAFYISRPLVR
jgi:hypothetical protein